LTLGYQIRNLVTTHFQPTHARAAFPCWDEPQYKARFKMAVVRQRQYLALSNMPLENTEDVSIFWGSGLVSLCDPTLDLFPVVLTLNCRKIRNVVKKTNVDSYKQHHKYEKQYKFSSTRKKAGTHETKFSSIFMYSAPSSAKEFKLHFHLDHLPLPYYLPHLHSNKFD